MLENLPENSAFFEVVWYKPVDEATHFFDMQKKSSIGGSPLLSFLILMQVNFLQANGSGHGKTGGGKIFHRFWRSFYKI